MLNHEIIINRLALIKQLYKIGIEQSKQFEPLASFSILSFHDSIEMFLKLVAEHKNINSDQFKFLQYWDHIEGLDMKESLRSLNARRVNMKHKGLLPSKSDIEISRVNTSEFFDQHVKKFFQVEFKDISLISLVKYEDIRPLLIESQNALDKGDISICMEKVAIAFHELIDSYEENKIGNFRSSPFHFGNYSSIRSPFSMNVKDKELAKFIDNVKSSIRDIHAAIKINSMGIDYRKYIKFKLLTPIVTKMMGGNTHVSEVFGKKKWTVENCQYCIDFVIDSAIKLQEFDFDIEDLEDQEVKIEFIKRINDQ